MRLECFSHSVFCRAAGRESGLSLCGRGVHPESRIFQHPSQSVTILRMEVPCCGGLEMAAKKALQASGKFIPWQVVTISIEGKIPNETKEKTSRVKME